MSSLALPSFDTLRYVKRLKEADVPEKQAEAQAEALREVLADQTAVQGEASARAVTESDAKMQLTASTLEKKIDVAFAEMRSELKLHRVLLGITLAGVGTIIGKLFWG